MLARVGAAHDLSAGREYRIGELAREAGITVRTLRYYQERNLLPPPRREGRIGWYSEAHLTRLRVIGQLLDRGHTLGGAAELLTAWAGGYDLAELLGFERAMTAPWSDAATEQLTVADAAALLGDELTPELLDEAVRLGYIEVDSNGTLNVSKRRLLAREKADTIEVSAPALRRFSDGTQRRLRRAVWSQGGCTSWYLDADGVNRALWPGFSFEYWARTRRARAADYAIR